MNYKHKQLKKIAFQLRNPTLFRIAKKLELNVSKALRAAPQYWMSLGLDKYKDAIKNMIDTPASPNTQEFIKAVYKYQLSNPSISMKDGILGPETLRAMMKASPSSFKVQKTKTDQSGEDLDSSSLEELFKGDRSKTTQPDTSFDLEHFKAQIGKIESNNNYLATNRNALGKYQFIWTYWQRPIASFFGRPVSREEFLHSPDLQENWMDFYAKTELAPSVARLREKFPEATQHLSTEQLAGLVHFKGYGDASKILAGLPDPTSAGNITVQKYLSLI